MIENGDIRTHHIHVVPWNGTAWNHYILFRDDLNAHPDKAKQYDDFKQTLALRFSNERQSYTAAKENMIRQLLYEASSWKSKDSASVSSV